MNKIVALSLVLALGGCNSGQKESADKFLGTFVRSTRDSLVSFDDTLYIKKAGDAGANLYAITRKMGTVRKGDDGTFLPRELKQQDLSAEYKPADKSLEISNTGEHYVTRGDEEITNGQVSYRRMEMR